MNARSGECPAFQRLHYLGGSRYSCENQVHIVFVSSFAENLALAVRVHKLLPTEHDLRLLGRLPQTVSVYERLFADAGHFVVVALIDGDDLHFSDFHVMTLCLVFIAEGDHFRLHALAELIAHVLPGALVELRLHQQGGRPDE